MLRSTHWQTALVAPAVQVLQSVPAWQEINVSPLRVVTTLVGVTLHVSRVLMGLRETARLVLILMSVIFTTHATILDV